MKVVDTEALEVLQLLSLDDGPSVLDNLVEKYFEAAPVRVLALRRATRSLNYQVLFAEAQELRKLASQLGIRPIDRICDVIAGNAYTQAKVDYVKSVTELEKLLAQSLNELAEYLGRDPRVKKKKIIIK